MNPKYHTVIERPMKIIDVAEATGLSTATISKAIQRGDLECIVPTGMTKRYLLPESVNRWLHGGKD